MMFLYVYADVLSIFRPGQIDEVRSGMMGPVEASQGSLLLAAVLMALPALMIFLALAIPPKPSRGLNIGMGALFTLGNIGDLVGESWAYYLTFGVLEIGITLTIIWYAWKWPAIGAYQ